MSKNNIINKAPELVPNEQITAITSQRHAWELLIAGKTLKSKTTGSLLRMLDNTVCRCNSAVSQPYTASFNRFYDFEVVHCWYENIPPQGILCKVSSNNSEVFIEVVVRYKDNKFFSADGCTWDSAEPITLEQFKHHNASVITE